MLFHLALLASLPLSQASLSWVYARGSRQKNNGGDQGISYGECRRVYHDYLQLIRGTQRMELPRRNSRRSCKGRVKRLSDHRCSHCLSSSPLQGRWRHIPERLTVSAG